MHSLTLTILKSSFGSQINSSKHSVHSATGHKLHKMGSANVNLEFGDLKLDREVHVWDGLENHIIGYDILKELGSNVDLRNMKLTLRDEILPLYTNSQMNLILDVNSLTESSSKAHPVPDAIISQVVKLPSEYQQQAVTLFKDFSELFRTDILGTSKRFQHEIYLSDPTPIRTMPYRISPALYPQVQEKIQEMLEKGVIRHSNSPWSSPVVLIKKKENSLRLCLDYRKINEKTRHDSFPIPRVQKVLDALQGERYFATLDLSNGFWQIPMRQSDVPITAFSVQNGHFECLKMPQGQRNATATFSRCMVELFRP
jgi:hypothetical protein